MKTYRNIELKNIELKNFSEINHPIISVIITLYNQEIYIPKIYSCIINQSITKIEIIFIDDNSKDNSYEIIQKLMKKDKRIIYIKNKFNKGQFYSRNKAVLSSKGKYIQIVDPDDFILNNILFKSYKIVKKYKPDIKIFFKILSKILRRSIYFII